MRPGRKVVAPPTQEGVVMTSYLVLVAGSLLTALLALVGCWPEPKHPSRAPALVWVWEFVVFVALAFGGCYMFWILSKAGS